MKWEKEWKDGWEQGDGTIRSLYYGCRPPLPGNGAERDARLLGNLGDAKPSRGVMEKHERGGVELSALPLVLCVFHISVFIQLWMRAQHRFNNEALHHNRNNTVRPAVGYPWEHAVPQNKNKKN